MKAGLLAPLYLSISWVLTVSYQLFTDTAVKSIVGNVGFLWPTAAIWINSNIQTIVFIYAFTWIFVLSSVIPQVILGKERGVLVQYLVVLMLSLLAFFMPDILSSIAGIDVTRVFDSVVYLQNPLFAVLYLSMPYLFMIGLDIRSRKAMKSKKQLDDAAWDQFRSQTFKLVGSSEVKASKEEDYE